MTFENLEKANRIVNQINGLKVTLNNFNKVLNKEGKANFVTVGFTICEDEYEDVYRSCMVENQFITNSVIISVIEKQFFEMKKTIEDEISRLNSELEKI